MPAVSLVHVQLQGRQQSTALTLILELSADFMLIGRQFLQNIC